MKKCLEEQCFFLEVQLFPPLQFTELFPARAQSFFEVLVGEVVLQSGGVRPIRRGVGLQLRQTVVTARQFGQNFLNEVFFRDGITTTLENRNQNSGKYIIIKKWQTAKGKRVLQEK